MSFITELDITILENHYKKIQLGKPFTLFIDNNNYHFSNSKLFCS